ncbi:MAG: pirin family protein [Chloroflexi bacterium]|nr:pirin family protein [Chloroflexota bacterium]
MFNSVIHPDFARSEAYQYYPAQAFPWINPIHWLTSHFAVGGWSPLQRLSGMLTAHMTRIAPRNGFDWHPHRGLEIYTWVLEGTLYHEDVTGGKGEIGPGELQRMFSGDYIAHMEMNYTDDPVRVIQIWFIADPKYRGLDPHYQQASRADLPRRKVGDADVVSLIGQDSPMEQHMSGRLTATQVPAGGRTIIEPPQEGEDLFLYVTDGAGQAVNGHSDALRQYDVILARPDLQQVSINASPDQALDYLSFYLPSFLPQPA